MAEFLLHNLHQPVDDGQAGGVVAIGNFDGVHRGHQVVLQQAAMIARQNGQRCYALSFEPHPRTLFKPDSPVFRLTDETMKAHVLKAFGIDGLLTLPFTRDLAATEAEAFVQEYLLGRARASHVVSGFNFHFGKGRAGSPEFLQQSGQQSGFGVSIIDAISDAAMVDAEPISSSRIRRQLGAGDVADAARLLGYHWLVSGTVIKGAQLGRTLNFPTANLSLPTSCHLAHGIYAVRLRRADGRLHDGVASYGRRPTFDNGPALLETFVFDFSDDLYGETVAVSLVAWIRGEEKFDSADALVVQMEKDCVDARSILAQVEPLSELDQTLNFGRQR